MSEEDVKPAKAAKAPKADKPKAEKKAAAPKKGAVLKDARLYDVIDRPVITEKATMASEQGKIVFKVRKSASKDQVREAVEQLFGVKVVAINTVTTKGKQKRFRGRLGSRSDVKKAIVTLAEGQTIDLQAGVR